MDPLIIFHADGFVRVAAERYSAQATDPMIHVTNAHGQEAADGHFRTFSSVGQDLAKMYPNDFSSSYFKTKFRNLVDRSARFAALAQLVLFLS